MEIDELGGINVKMELKGLSIEEDDYLGIRTLLGPLFPKSNLNLAEVTDNIISQNFIGHIIKQVDERSEEANDDDPVLSISTILPLRRRFFIRGIHFCTTNMVIFRPGNLYALCSPGNQHYQKSFFNFFIKKVRNRKLQLSISTFLIKQIKNE